MRRIKLEMMGMWEIRVGMRGIRVEMWRMSVGMRGIGVEMQGIRVGMRGISVGIFLEEWK